MEIVLNHALSYTTKGDVPVAVVARNLLANERLIQESLRLLGDCYRGVHVEKVTVKVRSISNASPLKGVFAAAVFFTFQDELEAEVPELIQKLTGHAVPESIDTLVTVLVMIVAIYVIDTAVTRLIPNKKNKKLKAEYKAKIRDLSALTDISPKALRKLVEQRFDGGRAKSLFTRARDFFAPAKLEPDVEILIDDQPGISSVAIAEIPTEFDFAQEEARNVYDLHGVAVEIHRADIDYSNQGWVAIIDEVSDKRKKMILPPDIDPTDLFTIKKIVGDVTIVEERQTDGEYAVKEYHLLRITSGL